MCYIAIYDDWEEKRTERIKTKNKKRFKKERNLITAGLDGGVCWFNINPGYNFGFLIGGKDLIR